MTNGDNQYAPTFLETLLAEPDADAVAFDYYSRYQRPTGPPCERFAAAPGAPACKANTCAPRPWRAARPRHSRAAPQPPNTAAAPLRSRFTEAGRGGCRLAWCNTDLGANALNWPRLLREDRRLGGMAGEAGELAADHFDGALAESLLSAGALAARRPTPSVLPAAALGDVRQGARRPGRARCPAVQIQDPTGHRK